MYYPSQVWQEDWSQIICNLTEQITYLDLHVIIKEDVAQFQVSVDDSVAVQVLDTLEQLGHVVASFWLSHSLTTLVQLQQGLKWKKKNGLGEEN